jgi:hypothetical protein
VSDLGLDSVVAMETSGDLLRRFLRYHLARARRTSDCYGQAPAPGSSIPSATGAGESDASKKLPTEPLGMACA